MPRPPQQVLDAFGVRDVPLVELGRSPARSFRADRIVLKHWDDPQEAQWLLPILDGARQEEFRLAKPTRATSGSLVCDHWSASQFVDGSISLHTRWSDAIDALQAFHRAVRDVARPSFLEHRNNPFAQADRAAWDEAPRPDFGCLGDEWNQLIGNLRPVGAPSQFIQGDPSEGNFLFADNQPVALIDITPYWRPSNYSVALFVADAIAWSAAPLTLVDDVRHLSEIDQLLRRAVLFRMIVSKLFGNDEQGLLNHWRAYQPVLATM